jgi:hypothetical protein
MCSTLAHMHNPLALKANNDEADLNALLCTFPVPKHAPPSPSLPTPPFPNTLALHVHTDSTVHPLPSKRTVYVHNPSPPPHTLISDCWEGFCDFCPTIANVQSVAGKQVVGHADSDSRPLRLLLSRPLHATT